MIGLAVSFLVFAWLIASAKQGWQLAVSVAGTVLTGAFLVLVIDQWMKAPR